MIQRFLVFHFLSILAFLNVAAQTEYKYIREGNDFYKRNNFKAAEKSYSKSIEKNKESLDAQFNMGDALYKQKKYEEAATLFESLSKKTTEKNKQAQCFHNMGNSLLQNKKYEECVKAYQNSLKLNPKDEDTRYNLAYAKKKLEQQQNQEKNDKNKDSKKDQNKDNQDQNKENQDQNKNDKKDQKEGESKEQKQEKEEQKQAQTQKMSKEDAKRLLEAMNNQEKDVQDKLKKKKAVGVKTTIEKDW